MIYLTFWQPHRPGSKYNLEMIHSCHDALKDLTENTWPGIVDEDALPLGMGASQATSQHTVVVGDSHVESNWIEIWLGVVFFNDETFPSTVIQWEIVQAPFDVAAFKSALLDDGGESHPQRSYCCSQSLFKCDLLFNPDPSATRLV